MASKNSPFVCNGASNHSKGEREKDDFYATDPERVRELLRLETFSKNIYEPAVGAGHIANVLLENGFNVIGSDIVDRGWNGTVIYDFINDKNNRDITIADSFNGDIITNPPYKNAVDFIGRSLKLIPIGNKVAMFLKLTFLESQKRLKFFKDYPPKTIYVYGKRAYCGKNGNFSNSNSSAVAYAWFIWEKGFKDSPIVKWIELELEELENDGINK